MVQRHTVSADDVHYDLMIEVEPGDDPDARALLTYQLPAPPAAEGAGVRSFDHRRRYLSYEGEISGGRGAVAIWDRGRARDLAGRPGSPRYRARLAGERLRGELELSEEGGEPPRVRVRFQADGEASP